jgi:hypothetical protein
VVKTRLQQQKDDSTSTTACLRQIFAEHGAGGFYKGMGVKMGQTVATSALMFSIYDALLKALKALAGGKIQSK